MRLQVMQNITSKQMLQIGLVCAIVFALLTALSTWIGYCILYEERTIQPTVTEETTVQNWDDGRIIYLPVTRIVEIEVPIVETEYVYDTEYVFIDLVPDDYEWYKQKYAELAAALQRAQEVPDVDKLETPYNSDYLVAEKIWVYLTERLHYSDYIAAAIIGNMMVECGGMTLNLKWDLTFDSDEYYGLCQWAKRYYPDIHGKSVLMQLEYLYKTMPYEFKAFGKLYQRGFTLEDFLGMTDYKEAALAFAKVYERCGTGSYIRRQNCAAKAYDYFTKLRAEVDAETVVPN